MATDTRREREAVNDNHGDDYCDTCRMDADIERVGPLGQGSWVCPRCCSVIYGTPRDPHEVALLLQRVLGENVVALPDRT